MGVVSETGTWLMAGALALAIVSHVIPHRRAAFGVAVLAGLSGVSGIAVSVAWIVDQRFKWIDWRFVRGHAHAPLAYLENQHVESMRLALFFVAAFVVLGSLPRRWIPAPLRWRFGLTLLSLAAVAMVGWLTNNADHGRTIFPLESRLQWTFVSNIVATCALACALTAVWWARVEVGPRACTAAFVVLALGVSAKAATASMAYDLLHPPSVGPHAGLMPGRGPVPRPLVTQCEEPTETTHWIVIDDDQVLSASIEAGEVDHASTVWIAAPDTSAELSAMQPHLRAASALGIRQIQVAVQTYDVHPTATLGPIRERRSCVIRGPLASVADARTYGEMIVRLGGQRHPDE